ncbi:hypothetical protein CWATWH0401_3716 [Crocosphaera watsonii WH 0401]|uniref:Uncharacterized protein n=1 Tax=Crocosphaera watsonii WH 0401 TaxID=555881 RepID=T2JG83_CROWT|nr:hypothetical protein CWATWH0401_3716 [Crocosphaera watsonii WH 0401]
MFDESKGLCNNCAEAGIEEKITTPNAIRDGIDLHLSGFVFGLCIFITCSIA